jgi:hypothetical protein
MCRQKLDITVVVYLKRQIISISATARETAARRQLLETLKNNSAICC